MTTENLEDLLQAQQVIAELYRTNRQQSEEIEQLRHRLEGERNTQTSVAEGALATFSDAEVDEHLARTLRSRQRSALALLPSLLLARQIRRLQLFDFNWYLATYPDVQTSGVGPFRHFLSRGVFEGRDPSPKFNTRRYLGRYLHQLAANEPALFHYVRKGRFAGLSPIGVERPVSLLVDLVNTRVTQLEQHLASAFQSGFSAQATLLAKMGKDTTKSTEKLVQAETHQLAQQLDLNNYLIHDALPLSFRGWPISADLGLVLVRKLTGQHYDLVVEFGSGTSTVLMARIMKKRHAMGNVGPTEVISFEHLSNYQEQTRSMLDAEGLQQYANVGLAPLVPIGTKGEQTARFYDCGHQLANLASRLKLTRDSRILVLVDGPPEATNRMARLPAFEAVRTHFSECQIEFVLDDYRRADERAIVQAWKATCEREGIPNSLEEIPTEKGCAIFGYRGGQGAGTGGSI